MTAITIDQMRDKLLTIDKVYDRLEATEPLESIPITKDTQVAFEMPDGWESELPALGPNDLTMAKMSIAGTEYPMTRDASLQACANVGLPAAYVRKTPGNLVQNHLNYHYSHGVDGKEMNALVVKDTLSAFASYKIKPFSNITLLEETLRGIQARYGDTEVLADYKFDNSLLSTNVRLVLPEHPHVITGGGMDDVPTNGDDVWWPGVTMHNSLAGKSMTSFEVYLFRFWCTNGAISTFDAAGAWNRRLNHQNEEEVWEWAEKSVEEILGGMEHQFAQIQALTQLKLGGTTADVLREIFSSWEIPVSQRDAIREYLLGATDLNMYTMMQAITRVANDGDLSPARRDRLMRIGGTLPGQQYNSLKAQIWREGHEADDDTNPYELIVA